ncbi:CpaF family protein [Bifidobacterium platyrrhinorum]|uniref:ATP-binding cassette domain-containing protein n=1 Tax=Bifidobacterium platyrrhinorum TaxID=2661628 RepID=A0A6L9SUX7_9BIFI|nr:ATPase, T2SS/T4P/T4SS family [Bifidobacterium platyrrhinorum]NEG55332.1 ATP-binding cassette domain-containing protein [Bifidobacterium platyrrhinorum]
MSEHREPAFGPLDDIVHDPQVTDVAVTCDGRVWADCGDGMRERRPRIPFRDHRVVREYAVRLCAQLGRRLDDAQPIADASSDDGIRVHAVIAPLVPRGASISIRLPDRSHATVADLCRRGLFPPEWLPVLRGLAAKRATLLITGGTGAGKTTLLKALLGECDPHERIVTVEEVRELGVLPLANHVSMVTREANVEGAGAVGLPDLVKATLRMRPDRVVLGECRGEEIADLLRAYNSGHRGGMTTLHADGVSRVPSRLASLGLLAGLSPQATAMFACGAFDAVLHLERSAGRRRLAQIGLLIGTQEGLAGQPLGLWTGSGPALHMPQWQAFADRWTIGRTTGADGGRRAPAGGESTAPGDAAPPRNVRRIIPASERRPS